MDVAGDHAVAHEAVHGGVTVVGQERDAEEGDGAVMGGAVTDGR
ncbi:hypothetical protein [Streptomyces flavofungini]|nr:hypothetical protein [Streptomyces flavofungini]WJV51622.1 hypothetical protein QUY26_00095 [Streptomyces flavofungini]